jgi:hypothetical protein
MTMSDDLEVPAGPETIYRLGVTVVNDGEEAESVTAVSLQSTREGHLGRASSDGGPRNATRRTR